MTHQSYCASVLRDLLRQSLLDKTVQVFVAVSGLLPSLQQ